MLGWWVCCDTGFTAYCGRNPPDPQKKENKLKGLSSPKIDRYPSVMTSLTWLQSCEILRVDRLPSILSFTMLNLSEDSLTYQLLNYISLPGNIQSCLYNCTVISAVSIFLRLILLMSLGTF